MNTCENCFFQKGGRCHRYPPKIMASGSTRFPPIDIVKDWCGEFKEEIKIVKKKGTK